MFELFKTKATAVGSEVYRAPTKSEALELVLTLLEKEGVKDAPGSYAVWADSPILKGLDTKTIAAKVPGLKFEVTRQLAKDAKVGITQMDWGIANTGTLAQDSSAVEQRLASSLTWTHIALVPTSNILKDLPALMSKTSSAKNGYLALITGPSRTADIERVLAIGVHGPERLVIVAVDELGGMN